MSASSGYTVTDQRLMTRARNYLAWQARLVRPALGRRVLEVGCGIGNFTAELLDRDEIVAIDADPACVALLAERAPRVNGFVREVGADSIADLARFRPDSCLFINALEHIEHDRQAMHDVAEILEPGGVVILLAPAFQGLHGPIDRNLGHYRRYSRAGIRGLADAAGLRVAKLHYVNFPGFFGWWINARVLQLEAQSQSQIDIFDRWIVPGMSRVEALIRPPLGLSLFAVLEKRLR